MVFRHRGGAGGDEDGVGTRVAAGAVLVDQRVAVVIAGVAADLGGGAAG